MAKKRLEQLKNDIADRIRAVLLEKDMYQQRLVEEIGTTKSHISQILKGDVNLTLETIVKLEEALGKPILKVLNSVDDFNEKRNEVLLKQVKKK